MVKARVIFRYDELVQETLTRIEKHGGKILDFITSGPSGGNPEFFIRFETREAAMALLREQSPPGEDEDLLASLIEEE